nr:unnamed protein product [Digitaria exilis]
MAMVYRRCCPRALNIFFLLVPLFSLFHNESVHAPMAAAADAPSSPELDKVQKSIMTNLSSIVGTNSWNTTTPVCNWTGVACSRSGSGSSLVVTNITLCNYGMSNSSIFASICSIDTLQSLDLSRNFFTDLGDLTSCHMKEGLRSLNLSSNRLSQPLSDLSQFLQLEFYLWKSEHILEFFSQLEELES